MMSGGRSRGAAAVSGISILDGVTGAATLSSDKACKAARPSAALCATAKRVRQSNRTAALPGIGGRLLSAPSTLPSCQGKSLVMCKDQRAGGLD